MLILFVQFSAYLGEYVVIKNIAVSLYFLSVLIKIYHKTDKILGKYIFSKCFLDKFSVLTAYLPDISELFTLDSCCHVDTMIESLKL